MLAGFDHRLKQELTALLEHPRFSKLSAGKLKFYKPNYFRNTMSWTGGEIFPDEHSKDCFYRVPGFIGHSPFAPIFLDIVKLLFTVRLFTVSLDLPGLLSSP